tara:strand:+ start:581 stop:1009 length:429 start_codon:yes stop_codon:yes gene_type:complete
VTRNLEFSKLLKAESHIVFREITNFENYVNFIPGCSKAKLIERNKEYEIGELEFDFLLKKYSIKSKNTISGTNIMMEQIDGPFETFIGYWSLNKKSKKSCEVIFNARFELPFLLDSLLPNSAIEKFYDKALDSFLERLNTIS